jgi:hypothetical protein
MVKSTLARVCLASAIAIGLVTSLSANHSWGGYHWARTSNPLKLKIGNNLTGAWSTSTDNYLATAVQDWNNFPLELSLVAGGSSRNCRPTAGRIEVCNAKYGNNGWLGIAQIWISGGEHITQAVTKLNDTYFNTPTYNTAPWRQFVVCQEVGHDFGLDHQNETFDDANKGSCMDYTNDPDGGAGGASPNDPSNEHPDAHDFEQLRAIYYHPDDTTTAGAAKLPSAMPPAMGLIDFDSPGQWGRLVSGSRNGRSETYELDFGGGNKVVTHVFWADPDADAPGRSNR